MEEYPQHLAALNPWVLMSDSYVVLDVETTNKNYGDASIADNRLVVTVFREAGRSVHYTTRDEFHLTDLVKLVEQADLLVAHNAKMELKWLSRMGADLTKIMPYCTMIGEHVLAGNRQVAKGLGAVATRYGQGTKDPYVDKLMRRGVCPSEMPFSFVRQRCVKDVQQTEQIFLQQRKALADAGLLAVMYTRCLLTPVLADIELRGLSLDPVKVAEEYERCRVELSAVREELANLMPGVNPRSGPQMAKFLYETMGFDELRRAGKPQRTATGRPMTDTATVQKLKCTNKRQSHFQELMKKFSALEAEMTKSLQKFKECCDNGDLLYAQFNQAVTATHRLSSSGVTYNVQFQNLPRKFKPLFKARNDGWLVGEIDGAQLEFRVAAFLGQDYQAYYDIINGVDVHSFTAQVLTESGQPTDRQGAKSHTFKPLYGGQSGTKAEQAYYTAFKKKYPGVAAAQDAWKGEVLRTKKLVTCSGLVFHWPDTKISSDGYISNSTAICNYPVQSLATAEIIPIAVVYMWHTMKVRGLRSFLVNTIHDSAIAEIHPEEVDVMREIGQDCFTTKVYHYLEVVYGIKFNVPLGTGFKAGSHWATGEEIKYQLDPPFTPPRGAEPQRRNAGAG
jgi:DNA polymerase I-like protein with 3'-5' exonuclease and polymerase domains